jgi:orotidine-5'-phosphate decarboxylase
LIPGIKTSNYINMTFYKKLADITKKNNSLLCVGLDSDISKIPACVKDLDRQFQFNKEIIDATHDLVCAYKPNSAFYEANGTEGIRQLKKTCDYINKKYSHIVIILDAKRADIGSTNEGYARFVFDWLGADAITLHPYLGREALKPFLDRKEKGSIVLCRTTNTGAGEYQDLQIKGKPLYQVVAETVSQKWNVYDNCGLVAGATYPAELGIVRRIVGDMPILIPGIGAQGGDFEATMKVGLDSKGRGAIINSSRGIIFASSGSDFAARAREEAKKLKDSINQYR